MDNLILGYTIFFAGFTLVFLLYQFEIFDFSEKSMCSFIRVLDFIETIFLILIHIVGFSEDAKIPLGIYYGLNILTLFLQFGLGEFGIGRKILDVFWIGFYALLMAIDCFDCTLPGIIEAIFSSKNIQAIEYLFEETAIGKILIEIFVPIIRTVILEAIRSKDC